MAFMAKSWLTSQYRNRSHFPISVSIYPSKASPTDPWSRSHEIAVDIRLCSGYGRQELSLTQKDADDLLKSLATFGSGNAIQEIVRDHLVALEDSDLLELIASVVSQKRPATVAA